MKFCVEHYFSAKAPYLADMWLRNGGSDVYACFFVAVIGCTCVLRAAAEPRSPLPSLPTLLSFPGVLIHLFCLLAGD